MGNRFFLTIIPEPDEKTRTVFVAPDATDADVFMRGEATDDSYECGSCSRVLLVGISPGQVQGIVFKCPTCGAFNDLP